MKRIIALLISALALAGCEQLHVESIPSGEVDEFEMEIGLQV